jgi:hypothetical protein
VVDTFERTRWSRRSPASWSELTDSPTPDEKLTASMSVGMGRADTYLVETSDEFRSVIAEVDSLVDDQRATLEEHLDHVAVRTA